MKISLPIGAEMIIDRLYDNGYCAYVVGGCVRDILMDKIPDDWDITTNALPEQVKNIFTDAKVIETGIAHGTLTVIINSEHYEVTTFRCDGNYTDHRHPDNVEFAKSIENDLARRDFTINAMAYNHHEGLIDLYGGIEDITNRKIRAVGEANKRFEEDGLRILRGIRFSSCLDFEIEQKTAEAMIACKEYLNYVAGERKYVELCKMLMGKNVLNVLLRHAKIISVAVPEIANCIGFNQQNPHHIYNVWEHTAYSVASAPYDKITRLAMLLHDSGKPNCFTVDSEGIGHFYGHAKYSVQHAHNFFSRSGETKEIRHRVSKLIEYHDSTIVNDTKSIKRWLARLGEEDLLRLIWVKKADCMAQSPKYHIRINDLEQLIDVIHEVINQKPCFSRMQLAIDGHDVMDLGAKGTGIGQVLDMLVDAVIEEKCSNNKDELIALAADFIDNSQKV